MNSNICHITSNVNQSYSIWNWIVNIGEIIALGLIVALASSCFTKIEAFEVSISLVVAYLIPRFIYSTSNLKNNLGQLLFLIVGIALAVYTILSIKYWTVDLGGSFEYPNLKSDDAVYYKWALSHYDGRCSEPQIGFKGISVFSIFLWKLFGVSIVYPIALNYMFLLLTIVMTGKLAVRLFQNKFDNIDNKNISVLAMLMVSLLGFLLSQSLRLQKESACALGIILVGYVLAGISHELKESRRTFYKDIALFVTGCLILAFFRTNYTYFAVIGAFMMGFANHKRRWKQCLLLCLLALGITLLFSYLYTYSFGQQYHTVDGGEPMAKAFKISVEQLPYTAIVGDYYYYPVWKRLMLLPVTAGVQFIIPFPWLYEHSEINIFTILPRFRIMWYFVGGICVFYYLYISIIHNKQHNLGIWSWWPLLVFFIIAYITGGIVSRYILPLQPLFAVVALYVLLRVWNGLYRKSFIMWMIVYVFLLSALIIVCYHVQSDYLHSIKAI